MGININWDSKNSREIKIAEARSKVDINADNNRTILGKHTNNTNLIAKIAEGLISLAEVVLGQSKNE
jgi:hypothetical protein